MHNGAAPDVTDLGRVDDPCMRKCYGVVWREGTLPLATGKLELRTRGLRLEGLAASRPTARNRLRRPGRRSGRSVADQIEGRPTVILERRTGSPITIATVPQPSLVGEIAERLTALQLGPEATRRTALVLPLKKDAHRAVRRLLEAGPPGHRNQFRSRLRLAHRARDAFRPPPGEARRTRRSDAEPSHFVGKHDQRSLELAGLEPATFWVR